MIKPESRRINIRLRAGRDDDILLWLAAGGEGNAAAMIRSVLHAHVAQQAGVLPHVVAHTTDTNKTKKEEKGEKENRKNETSNNCEIVQKPLLSQQERRIVNGNNADARVDNFLASLGVNNNNQTKQN